MIVCSKQKRSCYDDFIKGTKREKETPSILIKEDEYQKNKNWSDFLFIYLEKAFKILLWKRKSLLRFNESILLKKFVRLTFV